MQYAPKWIYVYAISIYISSMSQFFCTYIGAKNDHVVGKTVNTGLTAIFDERFLASLKLSIKLHFLSEISWSICERKFIV